MKIFSKIPVRYHNLATDQVEVRTHYYLLDWNFYTSRRQEVISHQPPAEWKSLKQGANGQLEVDEQSEYLGIV